MPTAILQPWGRAAHGGKLFAQVGSRRYGNCGACRRVPHSRHATMQALELSSRTGDSDQVQHVCYRSRCWVVCHNVATAVAVAIAGWRRCSDVYPICLRDGPDNILGGNVRSDHEYWTPAAPPSIRIAAIVRVEVIAVFLTEIFLRLTGRQASAIVAILFRLARGHATVVFFRLTGGHSAVPGWPIIGITARRALCNQGSKDTKQCGLKYGVSI